jgi:hypothetical protein
MADVHGRCNYIYCVNRLIGLLNITALITAKYYTLSNVDYHYYGNLKMLISFPTDGVFCHTVS